MLVFLLLHSVLSQANTTGSCVSGRMDFDPLRIFELAQDTKAPILDISRYDFTIDYGSANLNYLTAGANLSLVLPKGQTSNGQGARLSTTRYILYGRLSARIAASAIGGVVTTFITMADNKDEIDWEITGGSSQTALAQTNIFYRGIPEYDIHASKHPDPLVAEYHTYTIDWRSDSIIFSIDGIVQRTYLNDKNAVSPMTPPGQHWFPNTPSKIQISVWDGCTTGTSTGGCSWANGPIKWGSTVVQKVSYQYIDVQCYDSGNAEVAKWPITSSNPDRRDADPNQPVRTAGTPATSSPFGNSANVPSGPDSGSIGNTVSLKFSLFVGLMFAFVCL